MVAVHLAVRTRRLDLSKRNSTSMLLPNSHRGIRCREWSVHVPAGTPAAIIQKLAGWIDQFAASDETKKFLADTTSPLGEHLRDRAAPMTVESAPFPLLEMPDGGTARLNRLRISTGPRLQIVCTIA